MKLTELLAATALASGMLLFSSPLLAQDAAAAPQDAVDPLEDQSAESDNDIIVTGSRIRRQELTGTEPTTSISDTYFEDRNITNVANALNELPQFRGSVTPTGAQSSFGSGVNFINTFGLGSNRTLTLLNGRRVVSSNLPSLFGPGGAGLQVDLNVIPTILVERIDAVSIGGAPVYGSDAIAGTVNIILKNRFDGARFSATSGITEQGDAFTLNVSGVVGRDFDDGRGNLTVAVAYDSIDGVRGPDRDFIRDNVGFLNNCSGTAAPGNDGRINPNIPCNNGADDGVPARILFRNLTSPFLSSGGVVRNGATGALTGLQFDTAGRLIAVDPGTRLTGFFQSGGNSYQTSDQTQITSDLERFTANAFGSYELTEGVELFTELLYYKASAQESGSNPSFNTFVFDPGVSGGLTFDTATVPFINDADRARLLASGVTRLNLSRSNEDLFDNGALTETELKRGVLGVRGDFGFGSRRFNYEASINYGTNEIDNFGAEINQQRFINAVNFQQGSNGPTCTTTPVLPAAPAQSIKPVADPRCVPLNLFGFGQASPEALAYIREDNNDRAKIDQVVFNANVGGDLIDLWAGPIAFNVGYEHRNEKAAFNPSSFSIAGSGRGAATAPTAGSFSLNEVFGEVLVPLVSADNNLPLITSAEAFGRVRYVENSISGQFTAFAAGGKIGLFNTFEVRGNFTRSFRAPSITELFLPISPTFVRPPDLCTTSARNSGVVPDVRSANCDAFLAATNNDPNTYVLLASQASVAGLSGGNPNLNNEKADSYTFGGIFRPSFIRGLTITADYVNISIEGPIANLTLTQIASGCFDNASFNTADPINGNQFCSQLGFGADGQIPNNPTNPAVSSGFVNGQQIDFEGITGVVDYQTGLSGLGLPGSINLGADALYVLRRVTDITGVAPARSDGIVGDPTISGQARISYADRNWGIGTYVNYTGKQLISRQNRGPNPNDTREFDNYDAFATVNMNVFFQTNDEFRFNFSVTNVFNRQGQEYFGFLIPGAVNDQLGRRFSVNVSKNF